MTETLNIFLLTLMIWLFYVYESSRFYSMVLILSLLTVTKPTYQIQLTLLLIIGAAWMIHQKQFYWEKVWRTSLMLIPVLIQLGISYFYFGSLSISKVGTDTFKNYFVAVVYQYEEGIPWRDAKLEITNWDTSEQISYLWNHQRQSLIILRRNLIDNNLWTGSYFIRGIENRFDNFVKNINGIWLYIHLIMLPLMLYYLLISKKTKNWSLIFFVYFIFISQTIATSISTGQEDRLTMTGIPLFILAYIVALYEISKQDSLIDTEQYTS